MPPDVAGGKQVWGLDARAGRRHRRSRSASSRPLRIPPCGFIDNPSLNRFGVNALGPFGSHIFTEAKPLGALTHSRRTARTKAFLVNLSFVVGRPGVRCRKPERVASRAVEHCQCRPAQSCCVVFSTSSDLPSAVGDPVAERQARSDRRGAPGGQRRGRGDRRLLPVGQPAAAPDRGGVEDAWSRYQSRPSSRLSRSRRSIEPSRHRRTGRPWLGRRQDCAHAGAVLSAPQPRSRTSCVG